MSGSEATWKRWREAEAELREAKHELKAAESDFRHDLAEAGVAAMKAVRRNGSPPLMEAARKAISRADESEARLLRAKERQAWALRVSRESQKEHHERCRKERER